MKLKKIASLALAGLMAVGMLAGCGEAASSTPTQDPTASNSLTSSVLTELNKNADIKALDVKTGDDAALEAALKSVIDNYAEDNMTGNASVLVEVTNDAKSPLLGKLQTAMKADQGKISTLMDDCTIRVPKTAVQLYAINASVPDTSIAEMVAAKISGGVAALPSGADVEQENEVAGGIVYDYTLSVVTVVDSYDFDYVTNGTGNNADVKYVAVMVTGVANLDA